jgi:hypothetical protein
MVDRLGVAHWREYARMYSPLPISITPSNSATPMTSLISWVGADSRHPSSLYIASDSRISWDDSEGWDVGRKVFACSSHPDLFGYCGDVVIPSLVLAQVVELASAKLIFEGSDATARHRTLRTLLAASVAEVPKARRNPFTILHASRDGDSMQSKFHLWRTDWSEASGWKDTSIEIPSSSKLLVSLGTGDRSIRAHDFVWDRSSVGRTSRAVFGAFCDALASGDDPRTGGAPQLVGLFPTLTGKTFGIISKGSRYVLGVPISGDDSVDRVEWRNELFERCDGRTMQRLAGAQPQPRPRMG